jgi:hypothetical protein
MAALPKGEGLCGNAAARTRLAAALGQRDAAGAAIATVEVAVPGVCGLVGAWGKSRNGRGDSIKAE